MRSPATSICVLGHRFHPAQQRFHACHQFQHREGLGQVIVCAQFQAENAVHFTGARTGDDDRRVARHRTGALADLQAVHTGQHQVQHQRAPRLRLQQGQALVAGGGMGDLIAFIAQVHAQQVGDVDIVFDDQDALGTAHRLRGRQEGMAALSTDRDLNVSRKI